MKDKRPIEDDERNCVIMAAKMLECEVADVPVALKQRLVNIDDAVWAYHDGKGEMRSSQMVAMMIEIDRLQR